jgi:outer membrane protein TolC
MRGSGPGKAVVWGLLLGLCAAASAQQPAAQITTITPTPLPPAGADRGVVPITLPDALRLAEAGNLNIAQSRQVVALAQAALARARLTILPNLNLTSTYDEHEGNIQKTEGNIIKANRDSLFYGLGPSVSFSLTDAVFEPRIAAELRAARQAGVGRTTNEALVAVVDAYAGVLRARRRLARIGETLEYLTSERPSASRGGSQGMLPLVRAFVEVGGKEALRSDLARVEVEVLRRREEAALALQDYYVAAAELARLLHLDPEMLLCPAEDFRYPLPFPGSAWLGRAPDELVALALQNRPEMAESRAEIQAAVERVREAELRPFLPNLALTYGYGDFGGAPDLNPPVLTQPSPGGSAPKLVSQPGFGPSGRILHLAPRSDLDASIYWRLQNMGLGNRVEVRERQATHRQALLRRLQAQDLIVTQVVQSWEQVKQGKERLDITRTALFDGTGRPTGPVFESLRLNFERIRGGEGRPLEVLDSIRGLNDTLEAYGAAVTDYDRARYRLLLALGVPPEKLLCPQPGPADPAPAPPSPEKP